MIRKIFILFSIAVFVLTSCQQNEPFLNNEPPQKIKFGDEVPVSFNLSAKDVNYKTDYLPMRAPGAVSDNNKTYISQTIQVVITKKINDDWIVDDAFTTSIIGEGMGGRVFLTDESRFNDITTELRPGKYRITIVTGFNSIKIHDDYIERGYKFKEDNPPMVFSYKTESSTSYPTYTHKYLAEEVFVGMKDFTIEKTDDLHSLPVFDGINIELKRAVARLRVLLIDDRSVSIPFLHTTDLGQEVFGFVNIPESSEEVFCNGLDIWARPYYDKDNKLKQLTYGSCSLENRYTYDGQEYYIGYYNGRFTSICYFIEENKTIPVNLTIKSVTCQQGYPTFIYYGDDAKANLKLNTLSGVVFRPTSDRVGSDIMMIVEEENGAPVNAAGIFSPYHEYNQIK